MEGAAGSSGPTNINRKAISNAYKLLDILHDDTILANDKLPLMTEVLSGDNIDINFPDKHDGRNTLLHGAVSYGFIYVVKLLLHYKANVDSKNVEGETPLLLAFSDKRKNKNKVTLPIIQILIGRKADVNIQNLAGDTLLHLAVNQENIPVIQLLVGKADARIPNSVGVTPLGLAMEKNNKIINDIFVSSFNKPDPAPEDELYPDLDNTAVVADTSNAKDENQVEQVSDALAKLTKETSNKKIDDIFNSSFNKPNHVHQEEICPAKDNNAGFVDTSFAKDENQIEQAEDAFADLTDKYAASGAKHSIHGTVYQLCLLMMFALRAFRMGNPFRLGTEVDEAEQFDDIVFKYTLPKSSKIKSLFVQAKHKANAGKGLNFDDLLAKGNKAQFSLLKYFKSFVKIMQAKGQEASEIDLAICTNTHFEFDEQCKLIGDNMTLSLEIVTNMYPGFFKEGKCYKLVTDDKTVRLLKDYFVSEYTAELTSLKNAKYKTKVDTNINDVENKPEALNTEGKEVTNRNTEEINFILSSLNDGTSLRTFLNNLTFVVEQQADNNLVKTEFRSQSKTNLLDTDLLTDAFYKQIFGWFSNKEGVWLKNETIEKIIGSITGTINIFVTSGISRVHAENLISSPFKFNKDKLMKLNDIMGENRFVHLAAPTESKLTLIQVAQAIEYSGSYAELDSYMFMRVSSLLPCGNQDLTVEAFESPGKHDLLVVDCLSKTEKVSQIELTTLGNKLLLITTNNLKKKIVIIAPENHGLTEMFNRCSGYYKHTVTNTWKDFTNETQDILLVTQVNFQGLPVELNQVIDKTETELLEIVPLEILMRDEELVIGTELPSAIGCNESLYIDRSVNYVNQIVLEADMVEDKSKKELKEGFTKTESDFENLCKMNSGANIHLIEKQGDRYVWVKSQGEFKVLRPYIDTIDYQSCSEEEFLNSVKLQRVVIISDLAGMGKSTILTHFSNRIKANYEGTLVFRIDLNNHTKLFQLHKSTIFDNSSALEFLCKEIITMKTHLEKALLERKGKVVLLFDGFDEISPDYEETVLELIQNLTEATEAQIWITTRPFMKEKLEDKLRQWSSFLEPFSKQNQVDYLFKYWKHMKNVTDSDEGRIQDFASSLDSWFSKSISDKERELTGIPLQMKMIAECFMDDFEKPIDLKKSFSLVDLYKQFINKKFDIYHIEKNETDSSKVGSKHNRNVLFASCITQLRYLALSVILSADKFALLIPDDKKVIDSEEKIMINKIGIVNLGNGTPHFIHRTYAEYCVAEYFKEILKNPKICPDVKLFLVSELLISNNYAVVRSFLNGLLALGRLSEFKTPLLIRDDINNKYEAIEEIFVQTAIEGNNHIFIYLLNGFEERDEEVLKLLLGKASHTRLLNLAAKNNNSKFIKSLLQRTRDNTGQDQVTVKRMLKACDSHDVTSLHRASEEGHNDVVQTLLQWTRYNLTGGQVVVKLMLEACDSKGWTSLHRASHAGHNDVVQTLLQWTHDNMTAGQDIVKRMLEKCDNHGVTSLQVASERGRISVVKTLLQWTRDNLTGGHYIVNRMLEACDSDGVTSLHRAIARGRSDVVQAHLQWTRDNLTGGHDVVKRMLESCNKHGWTSLQEASYAGNNEVVQTLLQWTHVNLTGGHEVVKRMLKACDSDGVTSLHRASREGHNDVVQTLLQWTRDNLTGGQEVVKQMLESCNIHGVTSLHKASWQGHNDVVQTHLQWTRDNLTGGQDIVKRMLEACGSHGMTSLHYASEHGRNDVIQTLLQWTRDNLTNGQDIVKRMLEACASNGVTPLHSASAKGHNDAIQTLLQWTRDCLTGGHDIVKRMLEACDHDGLTLLHCASEQGHSDVVQTLLRWTRDNLTVGHDIVKRMLEASNKDGVTSLHYASARGYNDVVQTLLQWTLDNLDQGQDVLKRMLEACNRDGMTSLHYASELGHNGVVQTLLQWTRYNLTGGHEEVKRMLEVSDSHGETSLHRASARGHNYVVHTLLQWTRDNLTGGHDVVKRMLESCDNDDETSLHYASYERNNDVVQTLLQWTHDNLTGGQDIVKRILEASNKNGRTSLHYASREGHNDVVQTLMQWTLDNLGEETLRKLLLVPNSEGDTAFEVSKEQLPSSDCVRIMQWARGDSMVNLQEHITALKNKTPVNQDESDMECSSSDTDD